MILKSEDFLKTFNHHAIYSGMMKFSQKFSETRRSFYLHWENNYFTLVTFLNKRGAGVEYMS